jgi:multidrug efflux pump subunit AcrA (membrane-fusion protein)
MKKPLSIAIAAGLVLIVGARVASRSNTAEEQTTPVTTPVELIALSELQATGGVVETVGTIESLEDITLKSEISGRVIKRYVDIGDDVVSGQLLVELDHAILDTQLASANAAVARAQAAIDREIQGVKEEDRESSLARVAQAEAAVAQAQADLKQIEVAGEIRIADAQTAVQNAETALRSSGNGGGSQVEVEAYENLRVELNNSLRALEAARRASDNILGIDNRLINDSFEQDLSIKNNTYLAQAKSSYYVARDTNALLAPVINGLNAGATIEQIESAATQTKQAYQVMRSHYDDLRNVMQATSAEAQLSESELEALRAQVDGDTAALDAAYAAYTRTMQSASATEAQADSLQIAYNRATELLQQVQAQVDSDIASAQSRLQIQEAALLSAQATHDALIAPPREVDLASLRASLREAQANYARIANERAKAFVRAPVAGSIVSVAVNLSDVVSPGMSLVDMVSDGGLRAVGYLAIHDLARVAEGDQAMLMQDGQLVASGTVMRVGAAATADTNKVELHVSIDSLESPLVAGAFVDIILGENSEEEAVQATEPLIPLQAIQLSSEGAYVLTIEEGKAMRHPVKLGALSGEYVTVLEGTDGIDHIIAHAQAIRAGQSVTTK